MHGVTPSSRSRNDQQRPREKRLKEHQFIAGKQEQSSGESDMSHVALAYQLGNLYAFLRVATEQSISIAAKDLFMSPSAVSRSIHELERSLGKELFERNTRGIRLNSAGRIVLARAQRIESEIQEAAQALARLRPGVSPLSPGDIRSILFSGRKLHLLVHLAATKRLTSAAAQMNISQSGASMGLLRIESSLGISLFHREKRGLVPTEAADQLVLRARRVFAEFRHMLSEILTHTGQLRGQVSVGTSPVARPVVAPSAVGSLLAKHPMIHVSMMETSAEPRLQALRSGDIDVVIGVPRSENDLQGITFEPLFTDQFVVFARAGHVLSQRSRLTLAELAGERWITPWANSYSRSLFDDCWRRENFQPPQASVESADTAVIRHLLLTTEMVAVAYTCQFLSELRAGLLVRLPVVLNGLSREVGLFLREGAMLSPAALALVNGSRAEGKRVQRSLRFASR